MLKSVLFHFPFPSAYSQSYSFFWRNDAYFKFQHLNILTFSAKAESCATNLNLQTSLGLGRGRDSPATSPLSENKSFDSAVSSGIRSGDFLDHSASDLARFDLRINESPRPSQPSERVMLAPLRRTSKSSSSLSDKSGVTELGFESDHPAGGTIKKRPPAAAAAAAGHEAAAEVPQLEPAANIRLGAGGTLLRRTHSAESQLAGGAGPQPGGGNRNYEELQQLLDELHTNVRAAKDIQAKLKSGAVPPAPAPGDPPDTPPPPPLRTSSRLSTELPDPASVELPPPPPELQLVPGPQLQLSPGPQLVSSSTLPRKHLPPIAPKPRGLVPGSPRPGKPSYGTLPTPGKSKSMKQASSGGDQGRQQKSGRRISFDDNIQLIEAERPSQPGPVTAGFLQGLDRTLSRAGHHHGQHHGHHTGQHHGQHLGHGHSGHGQHSGHLSSAGHPPGHPPGHHAAPPCSEPLYTAVSKPGPSCRPGPLRHYSPAPLPPPGSPHQRQQPGNQGESIHRTIVYCEIISPKAFI